MEFRPGRIVGILAGTALILGLGVYGPVTLLAPLPAVQAEVLSPSSSAGDPAPPVLPVDGASAIVIAGEDQPIATAGIVEAVPMAGIAKIITALVVIDAEPVDVGHTGASLTIGVDDYAGYIDYSNAGARTLPVFLGETWTEREVMQAILLGSSNNHADTLARWAFGSLDAYVAAANAWLAEQGLTDTRVADATGLDEASVATATDAAQLAALVTAEPTLTEMLTNPATTLVGKRGVHDTTAYFAEEGVSGISRSFTDPAGVCYLFWKAIGEGPDAVTLAGAFLREPDYDTLTADIRAFVASAEGAAPATVVAEGASYARFRAPWGDTADGVAGMALTESAWRTRGVDPTVDVESFSTNAAGAHVGEVRLDGATAVPLQLDSAIRDPGLGWRLLNPVPMISSFVSSLG